MRTAWQTIALAAGCVALPASEWSHQGPPDFAAYNAQQQQHHGGHGRRPGGAPQYGPAAAYAAEHTNATSTSSSSTLSLSTSSGVSPSSASFINSTTSLQSTTSASSSVVSPATYDTLSSASSIESTSSLISASSEVSISSSASSVVSSSSAAPSATAAAYTTGVSVSSSEWSLLTSSATSEATSSAVSSAESSSAETTPAAATTASTTASEASSSSTSEASSVVSTTETSTVALETSATAPSTTISALIATAPVTETATTDAPGAGKNAAAIAASTSANWDIPFGGQVSDGASGTGSYIIPAASACTAKGPSATPELTSGCALPLGPLSNYAQVGDSLLGTLCGPTHQRWLNVSETEIYQKAPWNMSTTENSDATVANDIPITGVTRYYNFTVTRSRISADGVLRDVILINDQFPGPLVEANWGDMVEVTVNNNIASPEEGTAIHWHGIPQRNSPWYDGTPGIAQCPIAPGATFTYKFQAQEHGSSWYHAHYSAQYTAGVGGPMVIYGPSSGYYDIDLGPVMLSDWYHVPYFSIVADAVGTNFSVIPPMSDSGLINGRGRFDCSKPSYSNSSDWLASNIQSDLDWTCVDDAALSEFRFETGKIHKMRIMNVGANGIAKFSIDNHVLTVIAIDFVPVQQYDTQVLTLAVGQRTDIIVTANGPPNSSYWIRSELSGGVPCGGSTNPEALAALYYDQADTTIAPCTVSDVKEVTWCVNDPLNTTQPSHALAPSTGAFVQDVTMVLDRNDTGAFQWLMNGENYRANYNLPLLYPAADGQTTFPDDPNANIYDFGTNSSVILNVTNHTPNAHPMHLHGHNFFVLNMGMGGQVWDGSTINPENPMRRDTQIVAPGGFIALQFEANNPGVWPFHCHIAWHLSGGMGINLMTNASQVMIPDGMKDQTCAPWQAYTDAHVVDQIDAGS